MEQKPQNFKGSECQLQELSPWQNTTNRGGQSWFIVLSLLFIIASGTFRYRDLNDLWGSSAVDEQVLYQLLIWVILGVVALYCILKKNANLSLLSSGPLFWFFCYSICAAFSTLYSIGPAYTAFRSYQLLVGLILVISLKDYLRCFFTFAGFWIAINWFFVLVGFFGLDGGVSWIRGADDVFVSYSGTEIESWRFASAFGHPANISIVTALAVIGLADTIQKQDRVSKGVMIVWLMVTNILTVGRVGIAAMLIGLVIVSLRRRFFFTLVCALLIIVPFALMFGNVEDYVISYLTRGQSAEDLESANGRAGIYERAFELIDQTPFYGSGFRSGRVQVYSEASSTVHAHNALLESYVGLGVFGLFLVVATLLSAFRRVFVLLTEHDSATFFHNMGLQYLALLLPMVVFSLSETGLAGDLGISQICFLTIFAANEIIWQNFQKSKKYSPSQYR